MRLAHWKRSCFFIAGFALIVSMKTMAAEQGTEIAAQRIGYGNPVIGKEKSEQGRCQECHGAEGNSSNDKIPNHAGQYAAYLSKQLNDFQSGARVHEIMTIMAEDLSAADRADIGAYFGGRKMMQGEAVGAKPLAVNLFINGDPARNILPCVSCHSDNGKGRVAGNVVYPVIGGQRKIYLRSQLVNWKLGERNNSPGGVMNKIAESLSDDEIEALADYISGL
ncbi:MAG: c-type cytochrome [Methylobacter sp.]|nr:c-type cytochrome [Methylobacter sp.]